MRPYGNITLPGLDRPRPTPGSTYFPRLRVACGEFRLPGSQLKNSDVLLVHGRGSPSVFPQYIQTGDLSHSSTSILVDLEELYIYRIIQYTEHKYGGCMCGDAVRGRFFCPPRNSSGCKVNHTWAMIGWGFCAAQLPAHGK